MANLVHRTESRPQHRRELSRRSTEIQLTPAVALVLEPEDGFVTIAGHRLPAYNIGNGLGENGDGWRFTVESPRCGYQVIYSGEDCVEVAKWPVIEPGELVYAGDVCPFDSLGRFAAFVVRELIPGCTGEPAAR